MIADCAARSRLGIDKGAVVKFPGRAQSNARQIGILFLIALVSLIVLRVLVGANLGLSRVIQGGGGFFIDWEAARSFLTSHSDPYSSQVARQTQQLVYGRPAQPGENPYFLTIPFFLFPIYFPLGLIPDPAVARGIWMLIGEVALVGMALLSLELIEWRPRLFFRIAFASLSVLFYYSIVALLEGSPAILVTLLFVASLFTYSTGRDELTGALLVFALLYWEVSLPWMLFLCLRVASDGRLRVFNTFGMLLIVLLVVSLLIDPGWLLSFTIALTGTQRFSFGTSTSAVFASLWPPSGVFLSRIASIAVGVLLIYEWMAARKSDLRRFIWTACLTLAVTPLVGLRTDVTNLVNLFPGLALVFAATVNRWRAGTWLAVLLLMIVLLLPWGFFTRGFLLDDPHSQDYLFLFLPVFTLVGLYWTRWWFVRPARTWLDHVRANPG